MVSDDRLYSTLTSTNKKHDSTFKHYSAIMKNGKIYSININSNRTRFMGVNDISTHAERATIGEYFKRYEQQHQRSAKVSSRCYSY